MSEPDALFLIDGEARADVLCRIVGLFAQLGLTPLSVTMRRDPDMTCIEIVQDALGEARAMVVAEKVRSMVSVAAVALEYEPHGG